SVMEAANEDEANDLADDLIVIFRRLSEGWGERMDSILRNCVHTLMRIPHSHFLQIYSLLTDHGWRKQWMHRLPEHVRMFWTREFPDYKPVYYQPILTRLTKFRLSPVLSRFLGPEGKLDLSSLMDNKKIL